MFFSRMLPLRLIVNNARWLVPNSRAMSVKASPLVDLAVDNEGIATLTMQRPPVNSLNLDLLQAISNAMDDVERNKYKGMILTSVINPFNFLLFEVADKLTTRITHDRS